MLVFQFVAIHPFAVLEHSVTSVKVDALFARNQRDGFCEVSFQFLKVPRTAGIVARGLDTVARAAGWAVKSNHVIALPAMNGNGFSGGLRHGFFHINTITGVDFFCAFKSCHCASSCFFEMKH